MLEFQTDVVIIGNGPAGISLSSFLSGYHPYVQSHPDSFIGENINDQISLLEQDLSFYQSEHEARIGPSIGMYSALFDRLMRPEPTTSNQNCLEFVYRENCSIDHIVLGDGPIGGSWNNYDSNMSIISLSNWMDLPHFPLNQWLNGQEMPTRLPSRIIREYFQAYVKQMGIEKNFMQNTTVTNVSKVSSDSTQEQFWLVQGICKNGARFSILCKRVVLACGRNQQKMLEIEGELNGQSIAYNFREMKQILHQNLKRRSKPVVIVGDGVSAADAILYCLTNQLPVIHVFRRSVQQLKNTVLARLSSSVYPEYAKIFSLMTGRSSHSLYKNLPESTPLKIRPNKQIIIDLTNGVFKQIDYRCLVVRIGHTSNLSILEEKYEFLADYQSIQDPTLYAIGSVAGDHFVRFLIGGSFRVAQKLFIELEPKNCCCGEY